MADNKKSRELDEVVRKAGLSPEEAGAEMVDIFRKADEAQEGKSRRNTLSVKVDVDVSEAITGLKALERQAKKATQALKEAEAQEFGGRIWQARELLTTQGADGTWNYDEYMHGLYNGMEFAIATIEGREPEFRDAPRTFIAPHKLSELRKASTKDLSEELAKREGITTYELGGYGNYANLRMVSADGGDSVFIEGPAIITVNID